MCTCTVHLLCKVWEHVSWPNHIFPSIHVCISIFRNPILSCPILSHLSSFLLSLPLLSYHLLSSPVPSYPCMSSPFISFITSPILSYILLSHPILSSPLLCSAILSYRILSYPILSYSNCLVKTTVLVDKVSFNVTYTSSDCSKHSKSSIGSVLYVMHN